MKPTSSTSSSQASEAQASLRELGNCRLCAGRRLSKVLELPATPPANAFLATRQASLAQPRYPLELMLCSGCGHLQLRHELDRALLFSDYLYASGVSTSFAEHFRAYAAEMTVRLHLETADLVVDVGSNDGTLLEAFKAHHLSVVGVDPAVNLARQASARGIPTLAGFFDVRIARLIRDNIGAARLVTANNVFAHVHDLSVFAAAVRELLAPDGVFVFEVSYAADMLTKGTFDLIYHEHLDYHSVGPLAHFFPRLGLTLFAAERIPTHGGSIRCFVKAGPARVGRSVSERFLEAAAAQLYSAERWDLFSRQVAELRTRWEAFQDQLERGQRICCYGAPAKATTLLYALGVDPWRIEFCVDDSPLKQARFLPGLGIPIISREQWADRVGPDYCLILAWNLAAEIMERNRDYAEQGGRWLVPLPEPVGF